MIASPRNRWSCRDAGLDRVPRFICVETGNCRILVCTSTYYERSKAKQRRWPRKEREKTNEEKTKEERFPLVGSFLFLQNPPFYYKQLIDIKCVFERDTSNNVGSWRHGPHIMIPDTFFDLCQLHKMFFTVPRVRGETTAVSGRTLSARSHSRRHRRLQTKSSVQLNQLQRRGAYRASLLVLYNK